MTMMVLSKKTSRCGACLSDQIIIVVVCSGADGSQHLDMRIRSNVRDTLEYQIHRCTVCGFCAPELKWLKGLYCKLLAKGRYKEIINNKSYPDLANTYRAFAFLASAVKSYHLEFWAHLKAAWVCDDIGMTERVAIICRQEAMKTLDKMQEVGVHYTQDLQTDNVLRLDLLRRSKQFDKAKTLAMELDRCRLTVDFCQIIELQNRLILEQDDTAYCVTNKLPYWRSVSFFF